MSDVFYEMSKVTMKPVVNYTVLQIFLISSLNFTLVVALCTVAGNISHTFTPRSLGLFNPFTPEEAHILVGSVNRITVTERIKAPFLV